MKFRAKENSFSLKNQPVRFLSRISHGIVVWLKKILSIAKISLASNPTTYSSESDMCRNIKILFNFDPPVTDEEIRAASLQFVRKISGFTKPSKANEEAFAGAVEEVAAVSKRLLLKLETTAPPKNREEEAAKAKARAALRFGD